MITMQKMDMKLTTQKFNIFIFLFQYILFLFLIVFGFAAQILHFKTAVWYLDMASSCNDVLTQPPD